MELSALESTLVRLFDAPGFPLVALVVAVGVGAAHAVGPGHGKTITAAYLVTGRATTVDAALLGGAVAVMHTLSVALLATLWVTASSVATWGTDTVTSWMQVASAVVVVAVGGLLLRRRIVGSGHHHHHHAHDHAHVHHEGVGDHLEQGRGNGGVRTARDAAREASPTISRRLLLAIAVSGGLLPSPSAFLVLVTGMVSGRAVLAWGLVAAFAVGLAATLTAVGIATIRGRDALFERADRSSVLASAHRWTPTIGAVGVLTVGLVYLAVALRGLPVA